MFQSMKQTVILLFMLIGFMRKANQRCLFMVIMMSNLLIR